MRDSTKRLPRKMFTWPRLSERQDAESWKETAELYNGIYVTEVFCRRRESEVLAKTKDRRTGAPGSQSAVPVFLVLCELSRSRRELSG